ncbi:hypothetical protein, partial [Sinorhizobium medicae]|uniref:hypothetical protein n=1 Tax=Sinorhizobium medicae TaxID=110321 RepID=UPI0027DC0007
ARPHIAAAHASLQKTDKASESRRKPPGQLLFQQPARAPELLMPSFAGLRRSLRPTPSSISTPASVEHAMIGCGN